MARPKKEISGDIIYIFSTLSNDQIYPLWETSGSGTQIAVKEVFIKGGTGIADKRLITPLGVATEVSEEELAILEKSEGFRLHRENGYITVSRTKTDPEKAAADMKLKDGSAPITPSDYQGSDGNVVSLDEK